MKRLKETFGDVVTVGLSDHTEGVLIPPVAVALGAEVIEKHFTMSRKMPGPDHPFAIEPDELYKMCRDIEAVESSLGVKNGDKLTDSELKNQMSFAMRSVVTKRSIRAGETLTAENLTTKRPFIQGNIPASEYDSILGKIAVSDIGADEMLRTEQVRPR
jgi:sialic acid synthase SpsE